MTKRKMFFRMITASLLRRRSRMIVALLAIMIGATILSGLVTIYYDVPRQMGAQFRSYGANMLFTAAENDISIAAAEKAVSLINPEQLVGFAPYRYKTVRVNDRPVLAAATDMAGAEKTSPFWRVSGEWPAADGEIMIGKSVAALYKLSAGDKMAVSYAPEEEVGTDDKESLLDNYLDFTVSGVLDTGGKEEDYVYMSFADMERLTEEETVYDVCELSVSAQTDELSAYAERISGEIPEIQARLVKRVTQSETTVLTKLQALVLLVTIVVLALTMICVATTMTAVVTERRKEIGLRKALGATDNEVISEFMGEGLMLGAAGGLIGAFLGFLFAQTVSVSVFNSSISFRPLLLPITILVSVLVTGFACLFPIRSATDVDPALVLKGE
ncbi:MAG: ABC transporter permease [Lachnospiraceae bacterium]|nr:ABC transporter permease [Lachnospiraceae bacterium]